MTTPPQQPPVPPGGWPQQPAPPRGGWPQQQPGGWPPQPPRPFPVVKRIPEDQPFVLRHSVPRRLLVMAGPLLLMLVAVGCPLGLLTTGGIDPLVPLAILGSVVVLVGLLVGLQLWLLASGGPVLAVGPAGLWIKTRPTRGQAIWLPWEAIEQVYRRRWAFEKMVCVKPRDPRTGGNLGAYTALDSGMQQLVFGTGLTATLKFGDRSEPEIMQAIGHFAAGRCRIS
jgi:hypothetical protein